MKNRKKICKYDDIYSPADKYFAVNYDDPVTNSIYISLPKPPSLYLIDGYGLHPLDQVFKKLEIPHRLKLLEKRVFVDLKEWADKRKENTITGYRIIAKYWELLKEEQNEYVEEIKFIKQVAWYKIYGYWCFIKGKPTYLPPWYFCFLNFWYMPYIESESKYPEYRDEDRKTELFKHYLYTTKETFKHLGGKGNAIKNDQDKYEMIEMENRTFYGLMKPKRRRCGESNRALNNISCIASGGMSKSSVVIADTGDHAEEHWTKRLIPAWQGWPMFIKPIWDGNNSPTKLALRTPPNVYDIISLNSLIDYKESGGERAVDSDRIDGALVDEGGKLIRVSSSERWGITKFTLSQGPAIHGWVEMPSTIEEMTEGGEEFHDIWKSANFYERDKATGQTKSGVAREFIPAYRGYDKFIDKWGFSVVDTPTEDQIRHAPTSNAFAIKKMGAKEYHETKRSLLLSSKSPRDLKEYRGLRRREPLTSTECWMSTSGDVGFPIEQMQTRLSELRIDNHKDIVIGNFAWRNGVKDGIVDFVENPDGKFLVSLLLDRDDSYRSNEFQIERKFNSKLREFTDVYAPRYKSRFTIGIDTFTNLPKEPGGYSQTRLSDGGIAVYWEIDKELEEKLGNTNSDTYESGRFVCTYRNRPYFYEFVEDIILVSRYYGGMLYFERNKEEVINRVDDRGYSGHFKYRYNIKTQTFDAVPGGYAGGDSIDALFNSLRDHFELRCHKEVQHDLLQEGVEITGKEKLTRKDLLAAAGWALEGSKSTYGYLLDKMQQGEEDDWEDSLRGTFLEPKSY